MALGLSILLAALSAVALVLALTAWWKALVLRHPEAWRVVGGRHVETSWWVRGIDFLVEVAGRELEGRSWGRFLKRIDLDLRRLGGAASGVATAERFLARALLEGLVLAGVSSLVFMAGSGRPRVLLAIGLGLLYGLGIRPHTLHDRARRRVEKIGRRLPYAVDLAALMMGAGGTPREALEMMARQEGEPLGEEVSRALGQMQSGSPQAKALLAMARRLEVEDLTALVLAINRGEASGAPMAKALETQAEVFRFRRLQRAERLAVEAPVKMMFPNMLILLAVLVLVLGPVLVRLAGEGLL